MGLDGAVKLEGWSEQVIWKPNSGFPHRDVKTEASGES